jgi:hypothetical protein
MTVADINLGFNQQTHQLADTNVLPYATFSKTNTTNQNLKILNLQQTETQPKKDVKQCNQRQKTMRSEEGHRRTNEQSIPLPSPYLIPSPSRLNSFLHKCKFKSCGTMFYFHETKLPIISPMIAKTTDKQR